MLLHKRVHLDILKATSPTVSDASLDKLPHHSHTILLAAEELVAALYAPQDISSLRSTIVSSAAVVDQLRVALYQDILLSSEPREPREGTDVDALQSGLEELSVSGGSRRKKETDVRKWFDTCFEQIAKLSRTIVASLDAECESG